jgi:hypothetical protein
MIKKFCIFLFLLIFSLFRINFCEFPYTFQQEKEILENNKNELDEIIKDLNKKKEENIKKSIDDYKYKAPWNTWKIWVPISTYFSNYLGVETKGLIIELNNKNISWVEDTKKMIDALKIGILGAEMFQKNILKDQERINNLYANEICLFKDKLKSIIYNQAEESKKIIIENTIFGFLSSLIAIKMIFLIIDNIKLTLKDNCVKG